MTLLNEHCVDISKDTSPLSQQEVSDFFQQLQKDWCVQTHKKIYRHFTFDHFQEALAFVNRVGEIAEQEQHHPDIHLTDWNHVLIELSTHTVDGLSKNDFIVAAKIDVL